MTRRRFLAESTFAALPLTLVRAASTGLTPLDEQSFQQMIAAHRGQVLLVDFWATWCAACREEMPKLIAMRGSYSKRDFAMVTVSCDEPEQEGPAAAYLDKQAAPAPRYIKRTKDDDAFIAFIDPKWSGALPALFLYGRDGGLAAKFIGESSAATIDAAIKKAIAQR
jgi:thiol-disulfide isomerase/thioredoxin